MKYKAIIMDLDGTAVPHALHTKPSLRVTEAIQRAKNIVHVSVSTSRPLFIANDIIKKLHIEDYCMVNDSTQVYDPKANRIVDTLYLPAEAITPVRSLYRKEKVSYMINNGETEFVWDVKKKQHIPKYICSLAAFDIFPVVAEKLIESISKIPNVSVMRVPAYIKGKLWVTVTNAKATKLHGVVKIAELLHIHPDEIIGVGDGYNDYPLLSACGLKVAMGNAVPELKAIADFVAPPVEEDGVAVVIEKFILNT